MRRIYKVDEIEAGQQILILDSGEFDNIYPAYKDGMAHERFLDKDSEWFKPRYEAFVYVEGYSWRSSKIQEARYKEEK